ncbi:Z1 domain-containing protein [Mycobacterium sp. Marseille-P9652]|uniref:Z1 domain-containing protein n=1 Tax=Mycobacterium sp. Marseille-P9652 TaxID=2654950 RepID=UPI0012E771C6|nr:Z1 domain-containing protein [Mycobacterium sp. Marseille-P9652]
MAPSKEVEEAADDLQAMVSGGKSPEQAAQALIRYGASEEVIAYARALYEERVGIISHLKEPIVVSKPDSERSWYGGPGPSPVYWGEFRQNVIASLPAEVADDAIDDIDRATSRILDLAGAPGWQTIRTKGLVLGYVQSGKTTNFMGVIAKAADAGYRLFIVLSGITDNLRSQTQERIEEVLLGDHFERWYLLTQLNQDFAMSGNAANLLNDPGQRLIAVVKKNGFRLRRLKDWIDSAGSEVIKSLPIMVIDDEADQASLNVANRGHISRINGLIGQIIKKPRSTYVAYTATPFANLLTEPQTYENLYPSNYIVEMKQPEGYFGAEQLFGRDTLSDDEPRRVTGGLDVIRIVPDSEAVMVKPPTGRGAVYEWTPSVTPALADAIAWFLLATAARRARWSKTTHSTMLIHTSMLAEAHNRLKVPVESHVAVIAEKLSTDRVLGDRLRRLWEDEASAVPAESMGLAVVSWEQIETTLPQVLAEVRVIVDNYTSQDRLYYAKDTPATVIVIGGNTLSRGLTLEGLVSSYFVRAASAYDTLLQMGRWFGYRRGYADLPRIWMTQELAEWFQDLATVEEEIRRDIRSYGAGITPEDVAVRIRVHPSMIITSAAKMRGAVAASIDFSGSREQTIIFEHRKEKWLQNNITATRKLFTDAIAAVGIEDNRKTGRIIVKGVPGERVLEFLKTYKMHPKAVRLRADLLTRYIRKQMEQGSLMAWNLVLIENPRRSEVVGLDLGVGRAIRTVERSRLERYSDYANIKALVSTIDRISDTGVAVKELPSDVDPNDDYDLRKYREDIMGGIGLLVVYPIDRDSKMREITSDKEPRDPRTDLNAVDHVIGLGIFFPDAVGEPVVEYKSAKIVGPVVEDQVDDFAAFEEADKLAAQSEENATMPRDSAEAAAMEREAKVPPSASVQRSSSKRGR